MGEINLIKPYVKCNGDNAQERKLSSGFCVNWNTTSG